MNQTTQAKSPDKDPEGGLTAAGRRKFQAEDGSRLKPGVKKAMRDMTPEEMRRKGSWATRFYGRDPLPALVDEHGKPTRFALTAHAWGEPVPKTEAAARKIADKGRRLLERYRKETGKTETKAKAKTRTKAKASTGAAAGPARA